MKTIIVTGATGLVAGSLISRLLLDADYNVIAVSSRPEKCRNRFQPSARLTVMSNQDLLAGGIKPPVDTLIHCAFTRKNDSVEVATSILFSKQVFEWAHELGVNNVFYTSTRSVYAEPAEGELNTEDSPIAPAALIGIGKYGTELLLDSIFKDSTSRYSILRLASVNELKTTEAMKRPINIFVNNVINGIPINIKGGMQVMSYVDPEDIAEAIVSLMSIDGEKRKNVYNIGSGWLGTKCLLDIAKSTIEIGNAEFGFPVVDINIENVVVNQHAGLDVSRIKQDTGWEPTISLNEMIRRVFALSLDSEGNTECRN